MPTQIYVNLPVKALQQSMDFFTALGFSFEPQFTDENAGCLIIDDGHIYAMLLTHEFFRKFTNKDIADSVVTTEAILAIGVESREAVDAMVDKALASGGSASNPPDDEGFMYSRSFQDPDGHLWEVLHLDTSAMPPAT